MLFSVLAVFLSNYLGKKLYWSKVKADKNKKRYEQLYLPIIKKLYLYDPWGLDYKSVQKQKIIFNSFNLQEHGKVNTDTRNPFVSLIMNNIEYASPQLIDQCFKFVPISETYNGKQNIDSIDNCQMKLATNRFYNLVSQALEDSRQITKSTEDTDLTSMLIKDLNNPHRRV